MWCENDIVGNSVLVRFEGDCPGAFVLVKERGPGVHVQHDVGSKWHTLHVLGAQGHMGVEMAGDGVHLNKAHEGQKMSCRGDDVRFRLKENGKCEANLQ